MPRSLIFLVALATVVAALRADDFPTPYNSGKDTSSPIPAEEALSKLAMPPGFKATIFAAEPQVQNPIAMCFDAKGRLWVAENYTYAERPLRFDLSLRDRILVFEDGKGDGHATKRTVYDDRLQMLTSIARGDGGVWAMCPPQLLFIPDADPNAADLTGGTPQVMLDGFTVPSENYHNFANGLSWGAGRLAVWTLRRFVPGRSRLARHTGGAARALARHHVALPSAAQSLRGTLLRHDQSVGPRLG